MKKISKGFAVLFIYLFSQSIIPSLSSADTAKYFYDDLGRLTRVVKGTAGTTYNYDELGNLISVTSSTTSTSSPVISDITPNVLFVGSKMLVTITGQNLLTTESVVSNGGLITIGNVQVSDTMITAEVTALSPGTDAVKVTTQNGTPNYATVGVTLSSSTLTFSPGQVALTPGASATITTNISPPLSNPLTIALNSSSPSIATVPQAVTIPVSGTATLTVNAITEGVATVSSGDIKTVVFVTQPFSPQPGEEVIKTTGFISVYIEPPSGGSSLMSVLVSAYIEPSLGNSIAQSIPVSAYIEAGTGDSIVSTSGVSAYIEPPTVDSTVMSLPVSSMISPP